MPLATGQSLLRQLSTASTDGTNLGESTAEPITFYNTVRPQGNMYSAAYGQTANEPSTTGGDYVLAVFSLPANTLLNSGQGIMVKAQGAYGATANTKTVKLWWNPAAAVVGSTVSTTNATTIATTGALTQSGTGWYLESSVYKISSNLQAAQQTKATSGTVEAGVGVQNFPTATDTGAILIAVTGNAATAVSDINLNLVTINNLN